MHVTGPDNGTAVQYNQSHILCLALSHNTLHLTKASDHKCCRHAGSPQEGIRGGGGQVQQVWVSQETQSMVAGCVKIAGAWAPQVRWVMNPGRVEHALLHVVVQLHVMHKADSRADVLHRHRIGGFPSTMCSYAPTEDLSIIEADTR